MGLFSKKEKKEITGTFPPHTNTLDEQGVKIVLDYLNKQPNGVEFIIDGDFAMYPQLSPEFRKIPDNICLQGQTKSIDKLKECCKHLGQLLLDSGIDIQLRDQKDYLQIETHALKTDKWNPAVIMYDKTKTISQ